MTSSPSTQEIEPLFTIEDIERIISVSPEDRAAVIAANNRLLFNQYLDDLRAWRRKKAHDLSLQIDAILKAELLRRIRSCACPSPQPTIPSDKHTA